MSQSAQAARGPFAFSRGGMSAKALTFVPAIADNQLNDALARRFEAPAEESRDAVLAVENFLAAYFAGGCLNAA